jgi:hypothetical protein
MPIGFPWISLDSLVRIETYQWVTRDFQERFFHAAFVVANEPPGGGAQFWHAKVQDCSWGKRNSISDFLQGIVRDLCRSGRI